MRVWITGGANFSDFEFLCRELRRIELHRGYFSFILQTGAPEGIDALARQYAEMKQIPFSSEYTTPEQLVAEGKPYLALVFPGARKTVQRKVSIAHHAGVAAVKVGWN